VTDNNGSTTLIKRRDNSTYIMIADRSILNQIPFERKKMKRDSVYTSISTGYGLSTKVEEKDGLLSSI